MAPRCRAAWVLSHSHTVSARDVRPCLAQASTWWGMSLQPGWVPGPRVQPAPWQRPAVSSCLIRRSWGLSVRSVCDGLEDPSAEAQDVAGDVGVGPPLLDQGQGQSLPGGAGGGQRPGLTVQGGERDGDAEVRGALAAQAERGAVQQRLGEPRRARRAGAAGPTGRSCRGCRSCRSPAGIGSPISHPAARAAAQPSVSRGLSGSASAQAVRAVWTSSKHSASRSPHRCPPGRSVCGVSVSPRSRCSRSAASSSRCGRSASTSIAERGAQQRQTRRQGLRQQQEGGFEPVELRRRPARHLATARAPARARAGRRRPARRARSTPGPAPRRVTTARTTASADWLSSSPSGRSRCGRRSASTFAISDPAGTDSLPASTACSTALCRDSRRAVATVSAATGASCARSHADTVGASTSGASCTRLGVRDAAQQHPVHQPCASSSPSRSAIA